LRFKRGDKRKEGEQPEGLIKVYFAIGGTFEEPKGRVRGLVIRDLLVVVAVQSDAERGR